MRRLSRAVLEDLPADVARPGKPIATGIVHLGLGAFHRAHQAVYLDTLLAHDPRWGIAAVSLRTSGVADALRVQEGLYTLAIRDAAPGWRVIGAHTELLGPDQAARGLELIAKPEVALVTTTVTEKGYCFDAAGALDLAHPDIAADLSGWRDATSPPRRKPGLSPERGPGPRLSPGRVSGGAPKSAIGWLVAGLAARRSAGAGGIVVMPCDNLPANGRKLHAALIAFALARNDRGLADWIGGEVRVPSTMVDAITPASDEGLREEVAAAIGLTDTAPVQREAFAQWVIEDVGGPGPDLAAVGAIVTADVAAYERAKLRILNGSHSTLAYLGLLRGHATVAEAMADAPLVRFVATMIADEIAPSLPPAAGLDLPRYAHEVLARFHNPGIVHRLAQIAQDGSQKLPYRLGDTLATRRAAGAPPGRVAAAIGGWVAWLIRDARDGSPITDPQAASLIAAAADGDPATVTARLAEKRLLPAPDSTSIAAIGEAAAAAWAGDWERFFAAA